MYEIEQLVVNNPDFGNFCEAASSTDSSCNNDAYQSFTKNFANINSLTQADIDNELSSIASNNSKYLENNHFFLNSFTQNNTVSSKARSLFLFANPIEYDGTRYKSFRDDIQEQTDHFVDFSDRLDDSIKEYNTTLTVSFFSLAWREKKIREIVLDDFGLIVVSFSFVLLYVSFHLRSLFLAGSAMIGIALAYPLTTFINRYIYQIDYFSLLNYIAIFVILGIAADDVFVFTDSWKQTATYPLLNNEDTKQKNMIKRMNYTWRRTSKAIFTTSITTFVSFLATGFSKLMPVSAFGFFSGTLVLAVYSFAITSYPCCVIIYDRYLSKCCPYQKYIGI